MAYMEAEDRKNTKKVEMREDTFLKDLYIFMRKRDTPIERIPHLGFKQIDLFMMYMTVRELGGYHQVTTHQLWKQVYNTLGGNPRSTSAATCTRRHYERLLLPYECHEKGSKYLEALPRQNKHVHNSKSEEDSPHAAKRSLQERALQYPLYRSPDILLTDSCVRNGPIPVQYRPYYHPNPPPANCISVSQPVIPQSHPSAPQHPLPSPSSPTSPVHKTKEPLEHLRYLAERYKSSSACSEPLDLSCKGSELELSIHAASSFTPTISNKTHTFLNRGSSLCQSNDPANEQQLENNLKGEHVNTNSVSMVREVIDLTSTSRKSSYNPRLYLGQTLNTKSVTSALKCSERASGTCNSSMRSYQQRPEEGRERSLTPSMGPLNLTHSFSKIPLENSMEIQVPLVVFQDWVKGEYVTSSSSSTKQQRVLPAAFSEIDNSEMVRSSQPFSSMIANLSNLFNKQHRDQTHCQDTYCHNKAVCDFNNKRHPESLQLTDASILNKWHEETFHGLKYPQTPPPPLCSW